MSKTLYHIMFLKLKVFSLADAHADPKLNGVCECVEGDTYANLIPLLDNIHIVDWPFQFFGINSRCMINCKLKELNKVFLVVYVMLLVDTNLESKKQVYVVDPTFVFDSQQTLAHRRTLKSNILPFLMTFTNHCLHLLILEVVVRALTHVAFNLESTLVSVKAMARYLLIKEKFREDLKLSTVEDHQWHLRSSDQSFMSVVKV